LTATENSPPAALPAGLFHYILATSWRHQPALLALTIGIFLLEVVPLELQRRIVNDVAKHHRFLDIILLCAAYAGFVLVQGGTKLGLNVYRSWVGERAKRDLRQRICSSVGLADPQANGSRAQGTAISMLVAEVEPVGSFVGSSLSEPLLQAGVLATVIAYLVHVDPWIGAAALALFLPQLVFVPLMQHAMNRRASIRIWMLRQIGAGVITHRNTGEACDPADAARIDRVFSLNMGIFWIKFSMNFLMNLFSHLQVIAALLLGGWWVLQGRIEIGAIAAFISAMGRLTDPWGDLVNYYHDASMGIVKYRMLASAAEQLSAIPPAAAARHLAAVSQ
jgi:ABC-type multidrug transport system fused ATPase/permease subunit